MNYDYVIVGGGSAGATLAARLSEDKDVSVCLLEAGGEGNGIMVRAPAAVVAMLPGKPVAINNWRYETVPQRELNGRRGYQPRGKCLGGSSAINAMLYVRGHPSDYDGWAEQGCEGWSFKDVLPYFKKSEGNERGESALHGADGPLQVANQRSPNRVSEAFIEAAAEHGIPRNEDYNGEQQEGAFIYQVTQFHGGEKNGERCSAAAAYLYPVMSRQNLTVITQAHATRILFENKRAVGVEYDHKGERKVVNAKEEVILSGGAFNSPQLLLLSGIGDSSELSRHNIPMVHELPGVGKNLQDHLDYVMAYKSTQTDLFGFGTVGTVNLLKHILQWRKTGEGMIASPYSESGAFVKSDNSLDRPDLQMHFVISIVDDHARKLHYGYGFSCHVCVLRPYSRGEVYLQDANPLTPPSIDPKYLSDERDLDLMVTGVRKMRDILEAPALAPWREKEIYTQGITTDDQWKAEIRKRADTIYHPVGTCRMGTDEGAVVDPQLRVHGVSGLRVVDGSVMPTLTAGNTNAPVIMIAEKAADLIREARRAGL